MANMTIWAWVAIGVAAFAVTSLVVGLAIGMILGKIAHGASALLDEECWASAPLTRARRARPDERAPLHTVVPGRGAQAEDRFGGARESNNSVDE
jgi:hypothetical protein